MNPILQMLRDAATSKKFVMTIAAVIVAWAGKIGLELPIETVALIVGPIVIYVIAQGVTDSGKSAAKVEAVAKVVTEDPRMNTSETVEAIKTT